MNRKGIEYFNDNAEALKAQYNALDRAKVHEDLIRHLPRTPGLRMLDVGAGSGADAALFAGMGHEVVAVEPAEKLRKLGEATFGDGKITWISDTLPGLASVGAEKFDVVYAMGTIQYLDTADRAKAFNRMASSLKDGGLMEISYPSPASREYQFSIPAGEVESLVRAFNKRAGRRMHLAIVEQKSLRDTGGRKALDGADLYFNSALIRAVRNGKGPH